MNLLKQLVQDSSSFLIRTKEEIDQLFREMQEEKLRIDYRLETAIRLSIQKVKLQYYFEEKLAEYRNKNIFIKTIRFGESLEETPTKKVKTKEDKVSKKKEKKKEKKKKEKAVVSRGGLYYDMFITIRSQSDVNKIVDFFKANEKELSPITDYWIRMNIIKKDILSYYSYLMSRQFESYKILSEESKSLVSISLNGTTSITLKTLDKAFEILPDKYKEEIAVFLKMLTKFKNNKTSVGSLVVTTPVKEQKKSPVLEKLQKKQTWILDWNCVHFQMGTAVIYSRSDMMVKFKPTTVSAPKATPAFNYLKKYLNDRLPPVYCEIDGQDLKLISKINFSAAIQQFAIASRQGAITTAGGGGSRVGGPIPMSFTQALSKAKQMSPEEFKKYKSEYIDFLVSQQSKKYKVIPCAERLAHSHADTTEYAFIFTIDRHVGDILIVHENVNPDRSTLLFVVKNESYDKTIRAIFDFLQSAEINKRSSLRDRELDIEHADIKFYSSINHEDVYSWKWSLKRLINY